SCSLNTCIRRCRRVRRRRRRGRRLRRTNHLSSSNKRWGDIVGARTNSATTARLGRSCATRTGLGLPIIALRLEELRQGHFLSGAVINSEPRAPIRPGLKSISRNTRLHFASFPDHTGYSRLPLGVYSPAVIL